MATLILQGRVHITARTYRNHDDYARDGFRLQVFDEDLLSPDDCLCEIPLSYQRSTDDADRYEVEPFEIDSAAYLRAEDLLDREEPELLFHVVHRDDEGVRLETRTPVRGRLDGDTGEETVTLYSGPNRVGRVVVTVKAAQLTSGGRRAAAVSSKNAPTNGANPQAGFTRVGVIQERPEAREDGLTQEIRIAPSIAQNLASPQVTLRRPGFQPSEDQPLWVAIRNRTEAISFDNYEAFINDVLCERGVESRSSSYEGSCESRTDDLEAAQASLRTHMGSVDAYKLLEVATEAFLLTHCGVYIDDAYDETKEDSRLGEAIPLDKIRERLASYLGASGNLPYLDQIVSNLRLTANYPTLCGDGYMRTRVDCPCLIELIWSYWHEEGMLAQTMNAISMRFQNRRVSNRNALANFEINPLRPLNNLLWGFIQDELHRLSVVRRAYEYDHHYGLQLVGKAVPALKPADSRSRFVEAFHNLLQRSAVFYQEISDLNFTPDGFQLLNALKEVHRILAYGAHNQFGDLPWTARKEMLIMQWLLARPEMRSFLGGSRAMVPHAEAWMPQVDAMKQVQGWIDTSVTHFRDLAVYGEQLLLSIRYGNWSDVNDQNQAKNWAQYWRPEVQSYIYAYQAATGVDLSADVVVSTGRVQARDLQPSVHLRRQLNKQTSQQTKARPQQQAKPAAAAAAAASTNGRT